MNRIALFFYKLAHPFVSWARSRPFTVNLLFLVRIPPDLQIHYDTTTLLFRKALKREVDRNDNVLEMGIGQAALLSLYLAKKKKLKPHGVDISPVRVKDSLRTAQLNNAQVDFRQSDLFAGVQGVYTVIFFNPPYVHSSAGRSLNLTTRLSLESDAAWDGGAEGTDVLKRFIQDSPPFLAPQGKLMIGVQDFYVKESAMKALAEQANYYIHEVVSASFNPSKIYILKKQPV